MGCKEDVMRFGKTASVEDLQLLGRFEGLRKTLGQGVFVGHLDKPLAYWALPTDRCLPLALLGRPLGELLKAPLAELSATPGIGRKKIGMLVRLLARVADAGAPQTPVELRIVAGNGAAGQTDSADVPFDPSAVSEASWAQWRASVVRHGLAGESLGRFAPSLQRMTRVIWNTPLRAYASSTLTEIRTMKTHGEKRVAAILEAFHVAHALVAGMGSQDHLVVRIVPRRIDGVEQWAARALQRPGIPDAEEILAGFIQPLMEQVRVDATRQVAALAEDRLGLAGPLTSVRQASRRMGLTRARVYQLLNEINDILMVRWPTGRHLTHELRERFLAVAATMDAPPDLRQFLAAVELFYPGSRRGAAGPIERVVEPVECEGELAAAP
jgi:hypothetical protein